VIEGPLRPTPIARFSAVPASWNTRVKELEEGSQRGVCRYLAWDPVATDCGVQHLPLMQLM
jgi:hypothetical protein